MPVLNQGPCHLCNSVSQRPGSCARCPGCAPHFMGEPWSLSIPREGHLQLLTSHLTISLPPVKRGKSGGRGVLCFITPPPGLGRINGNYRDCVDYVAETAMVTKTFPFPGGHTERLCFSDSPAVKDIWPGEVSRFQAY